MRQTVAIAAHSNKLFGAGVIGLELGIRYRPVVAVAVMTGRFEIEIREAIRHSSPVKSFSSDYAGAHPQEGFARISRVRVFGVFDVKMSTEFAGGGLHPLVNVLPAGRTEATVHGFIRPAMRTEISFAIYGRTGF